MRKGLEYSGGAGAASEAPSIRYAPRHSSPPYLSKLIRSVKDGAVLSDGKPLLLEASVKKCHLEIESGRDLHGSDSDVLLLSIEHVLACVGEQSGAVRKGMRGV